MSISTLDREKDLEPAVIEAADAEDEGRIRERLGKYGLRKVFDAGGMRFLHITILFPITDLIIS